MNGKCGDCGANISWVFPHECKATQMTDARKRAAHDRECSFYNKSDSRCTCGADEVNRYIEKLEHSIVTAAQLLSRVADRCNNNDEQQKWLTELHAALEGCLQ